MSRKPQCPVTCQGAVIRPPGIWDRYDRSWRSRSAIRQASCSRPRLDRASCPVCHQSAGWLPLRTYRAIVDLAPIAAISLFQSYCSARPSWLHAGPSAADHSGPRRQLDYGRSRLVDFRVVPPTAPVFIHYASTPWPMMLRLRERSLGSSSPIRLRRRVVGRFELAGFAPAIDRHEIWRIVSAGSLRNPTRSCLRSRPRR